MTSLSILTVANLVVIYLVWGLSYLAIRLAVAAWPPFLLGAVRYLVAGVLTLAFAALSAHSIRLDRQTLRLCAITGLLLFPISNGAIIWSEQTLASGVVSVLDSTTPVWMTLVAWWLGVRDPPTSRTWASLALGLLGVMMLVSDREMEVSVFPSLVVLGGTWAWAFGSVWMATQKPSGSLLVRAGYQMLAGGFGFTACALLAGDISHVSRAMLSPLPLLAIGYLVIFGACLGFASYAWLMANAAPHITGTYAFVNPIVALLLGTLFGERLAIRGMVATLLVVGSLVVSFVSTYRVTRFTKTTCRSQRL